MHAVRYWMFRYYWFRLLHPRRGRRHMDPILQAYQKLLDDRKELDGEYGEKAASAAALVTAQNDDTVKGNALASGVSNFESDKSALIKMIQDTVGSGPPTPAPVA